MLEIDALKKTYAGPSGEVRVLEDIALSLNAGEFVAVQGASGCGKSTLLLAVGTLLAPDSGAVKIDGQDPYTMAPDARARFRAQTIGFVFQQFHLIPYLNVLDNILAPTLALNTDGDDPRKRADAMIDRFGLQDRVLHVPSELSVGERQRTALARALLNNPKLLLADEPTGNLDDQNADAVLGHMSDFASQGGTVLLVTHDASAAQRAQRVVKLEDGKLVS